MGIEEIRSSINGRLDQIRSSNRFPEFRRDIATAVDNATEWVKSTKADKSLCARHAALIILFRFYFRIGDPEKVDEIDLATDETWRELIDAGVPRERIVRCSELVTSSI